MTDGLQPYERLNAFIADAPLYRWLDLEELFGASNVRNVAQTINTDKVYRRCEHPRCKKERPFDRMAGTGFHGTAFHQEPGVSVEQGSDDEPRMPSGSVYSFSFRCTGCNASVFQCWVEADPQYWQQGKMRIRKVGQAPPWEISPSAELRDAFGQDIGLYKSALVCVSQSYGMAACAYLRRVLENRAVSLLEDLRDARRTEGASDGDLRDIEGALRERATEGRLRLANDALPDPVKIAGGNPLTVIYDRLSEALHRRSEQECTAVAEEVSKLLEHLVTRLRAERLGRRERREYEEGLQRLREWGG